MDRDAPTRIGGTWLALTAAAALACVATVSAPARAQSEDEGPAYVLSLELDLPLILVGAATSSGFFFLDENGRGPACAPVCDPARVNAFDRLAAGLYDARWSSIGDIATVGTMVVPPLLIVLHGGLERGLNDDVVVAEAALMSAALQVSLSYAVARPRPRVYDDDAPLRERTDANAARSFFSGHVAETMAVTVAAMRTFQRLDEPGLAGAVFAAGAAGSTVVGVARVASGGHFPSDVLIGAIAGTGFGLALPALHDTPVRVMPLAAPGGAVLSVALVR